MNSLKILFVEDNIIDLKSFKRFIERSNFKYIVDFSMSYDDVVDKLKYNEYVAIVTDFNLGINTAFDFFDFVDDIPIIIVTGAGNEEIAVQAMKKGAYDYVIKDMDYNYFKTIEITIENAIKNKQNETELENYKKHLESLVLERTNNLIEEIHERKKIEESLRILQENFKDAKNALILSLAELTESRDYETGLHLIRIREYCKHLSILLSKNSKFKSIIDTIFIEDIYESSILHDIGKVGIPDSILLKPGKLTDEEFEIIKTHTLIGAHTLEKVISKYPDFTSLKMAYDIAKSHHEKWNGRGYPEKLCKEDIPLSARIVSFADVFDALTSKRIYKPAFTYEKTFEIMKEDEGEAFDPYIFKVFEENYDDFVKIKEFYNSEE